MAEEKGKEPCKNLHVSQESFSPLPSLKPKSSPATADRPSSPQETGESKE